MSVDSKPGLGLRPGELAEQVAAARALRSSAAERRAGASASRSSSAVRSDRAGRGTARPAGRRPAQRRPWRSNAPSTCSSKISKSGRRRSRRDRVDWASVSVVEAQAEDLGVLAGLGAEAGCRGDAGRRRRSIQRELPRAGRLLVYALLAPRRPGRPRSAAACSRSRVGSAPSATSMATMRRHFSHLPHGRARSPSRWVAWQDT